MCANDSSYPVKGIGKIQLVAANGSTFVLVDVLFVPVDVLFVPGKELAVSFCTC